MAVRFLAGITYNSYDVRLIFRYRMEWQPNRRMEKWESGKKSKIYQMSNADRSLSQTLVRLNVFGIEMIWELMAFILRNGRIITCDSGKRCNHDRVVSSSIKSCRVFVIIDVVIPWCISTFKSRDDFSKVLGKTYLIININKKTIPSLVSAVAFSYVFAVCNAAFSICL